MSSVFLSCALIKAAFDVPLLPMIESSEHSEVDHPSARQKGMALSSSHASNNPIIDVKSENKLTAPRKLDELDQPDDQIDETNSSDIEEGDEFLVDEAFESPGIDDLPLLDNADGEVATQIEENKSSDAWVPVLDSEPKTKVVKVNDCAYLPYFISHVNSLIDGAESCGKSKIAFSISDQSDAIAYVSRLQLLIETYVELTEGSSDYYDDDRSNELGADEYVSEEYHFTPIIRSAAPICGYSDYETEEAFDENVDEEEPDEGEEDIYEYEEGPYISDDTDDGDFVMENDEAEEEYADSDLNTNDNQNEYKDADSEADSDLEGEPEYQSEETNKTNPGNVYKSNKKLKRVLRRGQSSINKDSVIRSHLQIIRRRKAARLEKNLSRHLFRSVLSTRVKPSFSHTAFKRPVHKVVV